MPTLDTILSEPNQTENSLAGKIQNTGFFRRNIRRISNYGKGIVHTITKYRKSLAVAGLVGILAYGGNCFAQEFYVGPGTCRSVAMDREGNSVIAGDYVAQRFDKNGKKVGDQITFSGYRTSVAMDREGNFVITWQRPVIGSEYDIFAQRYDKDGNKIGEEFRVNTHTQNDQVSPMVTMNDEGRFAICWKHFIFDEDPHNAFYAQIFDKHGNRVGYNFFVGQYLGGLETPAGIAIDNNGDFVIAWDSRREPLSDLDVFAQRYNRDGHKLGEKFVVNTYLEDSQYKPDIAKDKEGNSIIAWYGPSQDGNIGDVHAQIFDKQGNRVGGEFRVNSYIEGAQGIPSIAMNKSIGDFIITWMSLGQDGDWGGIYAQRFNKDGNKVGGEFQVNSYTEHSQLFPKIAMDDRGDFVVAWTTYKSNSVDTYARIFPFYNPADLNKDGYVDFKDFAIFTNNWLAYHP